MPEYDLSWIGKFRGLSPKGKGTKIYIAPRRESLTPEALKHGSHCFYSANTPYLQLPRKRSSDGATTG